MASVGVGGQGAIAKRRANALGNDIARAKRFTNGSLQSHNARIQVGGQVAVLMQERVGEELPQ